MTKLSGTLRSFVSLSLALVLFLGYGVLHSNARLTDYPKNYGYDNPYLDKYLSGKVSVPPPFGGAIQTIIFCYNYGVRWTRVGPPRGGDYIWVPGVTKTYEFGPPTHNGQWLLGLYAPKYFCIVSPNPLVIFAGIEMTMLGSSR